MIFLFTALSVKCFFFTDEERNSSSSTSPAMNGFHIVYFDAHLHTVRSKHFGLLHKALKELNRVGATLKEKMVSF